MNKFSLSLALVVLALGSQSTYAQAQKKYKAKVAPAPAAPAATAPEPVYEAAAPAAPAPAYETIQTIQGALDGVYGAVCSRVTGSGGSLTAQRSIELTESGAKFQDVTRFYTSEDCSGSLYAAFATPIRANRLVAQRSFTLPAGQGQRIVWYTQQTNQEAEMIFFGAVVKNPQNAAQMLVIFNNSVLQSVPIRYSAQAEQFILSATNAGLNISGSRSPGAALDAQGYPQSFGENSYYTRLQ